ncbi:hypothetical protein NA78x_005679 [Anatilimnocola sp. NA78]|uniref:hypothetical protein n=1 Tax=Anatilimnocola sp. NA78 TaxID=3415683 RepID=UPI003CE4F8B5
MKRFRCCQFSIRSLLLLLTCLGVVLLSLRLLYERGERQQRAVEEIRKIGGGWKLEPHTLYSNYDYCFRDVQHVALTSRSLRDEQLVLLQEFPRLKTLSLSCSPVTDASLPYIRPLKRLEYLDLRGTKLSDAAIAQLKRELPSCEIETMVTRRCSKCRQIFSSRDHFGACPACE